MKKATKNTLITLVVLLFIQVSFGQKLTEKQLDSSFSALKVLPNDTDKVDQLIKLYKNSSRSRLTNERYVDEAIAVSEEIFYIKGLGESYDRKGLTARNNSDFTNAIAFHKRALNYLTKASDTLLTIKCLNNLGVTYRKLNLEEEAFDFYFQALDLAEKTGHEKSIAIALNGIGNVFIDTEDYDKALHYFKRVYGLDLKNDYIKGQEYSLSNIGECFLYKKSYDSAYYYINTALNLTKKHKHQSSEAIRYNLLGLLFQKKGNYKTSTDYYKQAIPTFTNSNNVRYLSNTLINIGKNELQTNHLNEAFENISVGLNAAKAIKSKENISLGYNAMVDYYTLTKNYEKALLAHKNAKVFHDSIVNEASQKSIISTQIEYETAKKDLQIQNLAKEKEQSENKANTQFNRLIILTVIGVLVLIFLGYLLYLYRRNSDLELEHKNAELQNYIHQIKDLEDKVEGNSLTTTKNISEKFMDFGLSKREIEVFTHITSGLSNEEIAEKMFISKNTIKTHIKNIYAKLDVKNRIQAMKKINTI